MTKEEIYLEMDVCLKVGSLSCFEEQVDRVLKHFDTREASTILAFYISKNFTTYKADSMAGLLQSMIWKDPALAQINHPENPLFKATVICGSVDLYECYMEEAVEPYLKDKDEDTAIDYYMELQLTATSLTDYLFQKYNPLIKGVHFNGGIHQEDNKHLLSIPHEDFEQMDTVVENFNAILGRRDILKDLEGRVDDAI